MPRRRVKQLYQRFGLGYILNVSVTAEHILHELKALPPADRRKVLAQVGKAIDDLPAASDDPGHARCSDPARAKEALRALDGKFAGDGLRELLLRERAKDRLREQAQLKA